MQIDRERATGVLQKGGKILRRITLPKHFNNTRLKRERLWMEWGDSLSGAYWDTRALLAFFEALCFCSLNVKR